MSFLGGKRGVGAGKEGAYFFQQSKNAVARLVEKNNTIPQPSSSEMEIGGGGCGGSSTSPDILPEILAHSLPPKVFRQSSSSSPSSSSTIPSSKWSIGGSSSSSSSSASPDVFNPLRRHLSLPQVTFGPNRWQLPAVQSSVIASTANELRQHQYQYQYTQVVNPHKLRAASEGLAQIGKAFVIATAIIFGGAAFTFALAASKLDLHSSDDIRTKGRDFVQPKLNNIKEQLSPLRDWAGTTSKKWHIENGDEIKDRPIVKELSMILGSKTSAKPE